MAEATPRSDDKSAPYPKALNSAAVLTLAVVLVLVAPLVLWLLATLLPLTPFHRYNHSAQPNCVAAIVDELATYGNFSLDPCHDFSHFACYDHAAMASRDVQRDRFVKTIVNLSVDGTLKSKASMLVGLLYSGCMERMANTTITPEMMAIMALETVRSWGTLEGGASGKVSVVSIIATMDIRYAMKLGMTYTITVDPAAKRAVMTVKGLQARDVSIPGVDTGVFVNRSLLALSGRIGYNFTFWEIPEMINDINAMQEGKNFTIHGDYSLLASVYATPLLGAMIRNMCDCNEFLSVNLQNRYDIYSQLAAFSNSKPPVVLAYLSLWTAASVLAGEMSSTYCGGKDEYLSTANSSQFCVKNTMRFFHIWDIIAVEQLGTAEKDQALRSLFEIVSAAGLSEIREMFADHEDVAKLLVGAMSKLKLLLPPQVVAPYRRILPVHREPYFTDTLAMRDFWVRARVLDSSRDVLEAWSQRENAADKHVRVTTQFVAFTPDVYSELRLECGPNALFLNAHLVGVHFVDSLVQRLCTRGKPEDGLFSTALPQVVHDRLCVDDPYRLEGVAYPQLALRVVKRALGKVEDWHQHYYTWRSRKWSESQVFYQLFYAREACAHAAHLSPSYLQRSAEMLIALDDFRKAFGCSA